jgi:hypothetical protein
VGLVSSGQGGVQHILESENIIKIYEQCCGFYFSNAEEKKFGPICKEKTYSVSRTKGQKAPDLGSGSATLFRRLFYRRYVQGRVADPDPD